MPRSQDLINAQTTTVIPASIQKRFEYSGVDPFNCIYAGSAPRGVSVDESVWTLIKYTYDGNNNCLTETIAYDSWTNRSTANYA